MKDSVAISVNNVTKTYKLYDNHADRVKETFHPFRKKYHRTFNALSDISFQVNKGETLGIIGRNGSGKSTLLQIICGIQQATSGSVEVNGRVSALLELGAGFNPEFTGRQNVYINASILGLKREEIDERIHDIIAFADIGDFLDQPIKTYSSGMVVRLAFAVIAHVNAEILVIDEALAVGDAFFVQKCMRYLHEFMKKGILLFVSHDTGAILNLTNKAILLDKGQIALAGSPKEVTEKYLEKQYESLQGEKKVLISTKEENDKICGNDTAPDPDILLNSLSSSPCHNEVQFFDFGTQLPSFGEGGAKIYQVFLCDSDKNPLIYVAGGEQVQLHVRCKALQKIISPIIGFQVRDRLGQLLFGDNTSFAYMHRPLDVERGDDFGAEFHFSMPILPNGDYSVSPAIAEGTQESHVQHHWIHDALIIKVHSPRICFGCFGVTMNNIILKKYN